MLNIGCHLSSSKGYEAMGKTALSIGANTFQFFTRNPRGSKARKLDLEDIEKFLKICRENGFVGFVGHAPYTLNACSAEERPREFAREVMEDDIRRMEHMPNNYYNFHPGSHGGQGVEVGIQLITNTLNEIIQPNQTTIILLETMAGKGTEVGGTFEELSQILDGVKYQDKMGVCLDTCHIYDAGYDIVNDLEGVLQEFDQIIGLDKLYAIHLNDSIHGHGSRKDRHEKLGEGHMGIKTFEEIINHPKLRHLPFVLETPNELDGYAAEINVLKELFRENSL
ncbi:MAG: apurinic endonuclease Apn1 [Herbinix sp.]|nr:apurinic endonuclease Apn1 [Herbinix sp.]